MDNEKKNLQEAPEEDGKQNSQSMKAQEPMHLEAREQALKEVAGTAEDDTTLPTARTRARAKEKTATSRRVRARAKMARGTRAQREDPKEAVGTAVVNTTPQTARRAKERAPKRIGWDRPQRRTGPRHLTTFPH